MRINTVGNKPDSVKVNAKNADTVTIKGGQAGLLVFNATDDGLAVVLPSTSNSTQLQNAFQFGVVAETTPVGALCDVIVYGYCVSLQLTRQTRASSTAVWNSEAVRSVGEYLSIESVANGFATVASFFQCPSVSTAGTPQSLPNPNAVAFLGQSLNSYVSSASSTADTRTAITASVKAFVRMM